jgi:hypothetical protein
MAATVSGAIKAKLEGLGLGVPVYRDGAPVAHGKPAEPPYVTVQEGIGYAPERHGDFGSTGAHQGEQEQVQVDVWQYARVPAATVGQAANAESYTLPGAIRRALHGAKLGSIGSGADLRRIYGVSVVSGQRWPISDNIVRHTFTVTVRRDA